MPEIHQAAATGYTKGASTYQHGRPDYPDQVGTWLTDTLKLDANKSVLDLGAGTGKFLPLLQATGATVLALEPVDNMRARIEKNFNNVTPLASNAEAIPLADASMDCILCAQAFHWFANKAALAEIHRVLKPGGSLGLIWNVRDETCNWVAALTKIMTPYEGDVPRYHTGQWRALFPAPGFSPLRETQFTNHHTGTPEQVIIDRVLSVSFIARLSKAEHQNIIEKIHALIATTPELTGKDIVSFPYTTVAFSCTKQA